jgi:hypothetical protein
MSLKIRCRTVVASYPPVPPSESGCLNARFVQLAIPVFLPSGKVPMTLFDFPEVAFPWVPARWRPGAFFRKSRKNPKWESCAGRPHDGPKPRGLRSPDILSTPSSFAVSFSSSL